MAILFSGTITTAATATGNTLKLREISAGNLQGVLFAAVFTYGSGGTNVNTFIQTSFDGTVWFDVATFATWTTSSAKGIAAISAATTATTSSASGDGTLAASTVLPGALGPLWRAKVVSTGTYATNTTLTIYATGLTTSP